MHLIDGTLIITGDICIALHGRHSQNKFYQTNLSKEVKKITA